VRILANGKFVARDGGDTWPTPMYCESGENSGLEWRLRYASDAQLVKDRFCAASVVAAYGALIMLPEKRRNEVIRDLRAAINSTRNTSDGGGMLEAAAQSAPRLDPIERRTARKTRDEHGN